MVAETLRRAGDFSPDALELIDANLRLPHLKKRPGLRSWPVLVEKGKDKVVQPQDGVEATADDLFKVYNSFGDLSEEHKHLKGTPS